MSYLGSGSSKLHIRSHVTPITVFYLTRGYGKITTFGMSCCSGISIRKYVTNNQIPLTLYQIRRNGTVPIRVSGFSTIRNFSDFSRGAISSEIKVTSGCSACSLHPNGNTIEFRIINIYVSTIPATIIVPVP